MKRIVSLFFLPLALAAPWASAATLASRLAERGFVSLANELKLPPQQATIEGTTRDVFRAPVNGASFELPVDGSGKILLPAGKLPSPPPGSLGWRVSYQFDAEDQDLQKRVSYTFVSGTGPFQAMELPPPGKPTPRARVSMREALSAEAKVSFALGVLPAGARLHAAYALLDDWTVPRNSGATFSIAVAATNEATVTLHLDDVTLREQVEGPPWQVVDLDLAAYAGKDITLTFMTADVSGAPSPNLAYPLWGDVQVYTQNLPPSRPGPSVILVSLDTLRADRLGCYGYPRGTSPNIDALAAESYLFENALSPAPMTTPAHASLLTGVSPYLHRAGVFSEGFRLGAQWTTLAQLLSARGYRTCAQTEGIGVTGTIGFARGFQCYSDGPSPGRHQRMIVNETFSHAAKEIQAWGHLPLFDFVHTYQLHDPYDSPPEVLARFVDPAYKGPAMDDPTLAATPEQRRNASDRYDAGIAYTDAALGSFLRSLREQGRLDDAWIIVVSDHGEEFWEHGGSGHARTLYQEALHVPLLIRPPHGVSGGKRIARPVLTSDVFATILAITNTPIPDSRDSLDLLPLAKEVTAPYPRETLYGFYRGYKDGATPSDPDLEWEVFSSRTPAYSYIATTPEVQQAPAKTKEELFQADADPAQQHDLAANQPGPLQTARQGLQQWRKTEEERRTPGSAPPEKLDREQIDALKGLGYLR